MFLQKRSGCGPPGVESRGEQGSHPKLEVNTGTRHKGIAVAGGGRPEILGKGVMPLETILQAVANVGFPMAICIYLLVRIEGKLEALSESISELAGVVENARWQEEKR